MCYVYNIKGQVRIGLEQYYDGLVGSGRASDGKANLGDGDDCVPK